MAVYIDKSAAFGADTKASPGHRGKLRTGWASISSQRKGRTNRFMRERCGFPVSAAHGTFTSTGQVGMLLTWRYGNDVVMQWCASRPDGVGIRQYSDGSTFVGSMHSIKTRTSLPGGLGVCTLANKNWIAGECKPFPFER